jgi:hypothetical protein
VFQQVAGSPGCYVFTALCAAGSVTLGIKNITSAGINEAVSVRFVVVKSVNA